MVIHLARSTSRLPQVENTLDKVPLHSHIVTAVDGQQLSDEQSRAYVPKLLRPTYPFRLRQSEIAAFHSHRACWRQIIDDGLDSALILEDDLKLEPEIFHQALNLAISNARPGDFVRFPIKLRENSAGDIATSGTVKLQSTEVIGLGMVAQLVTRDAAKALLDASENFDRPVDTFLQMQWVHDVQVLTVWPSGVSEISNELGGSTISRKSSVIEKLRREIMRPLYRSKIRQMAKRHLHAQK